MLKNHPWRTFPAQAISVVALMALILGVLSGCTTAAAGGAVVTGTPIKIGASLELTGAFSQDGVATKQGYLLWQDYINSHGGLLGRPVQFDILDNHTDLNTTYNDYKTLITSHHDDLYVGPFADDYTVEAAKAIALYGYPLVEGTGVAPEVYQAGAQLKNIFGVSLPAANTLNSFVNFVLSLPPGKRPTTAAYATEADPYLSPIVHNALNALSKGGITTVYDPPDYNPNNTSTQYWDKYADQIAATHADIVVLGTATSDAVEFVLRFRHDHYNPKVLVEVSGPDQGTQFTGPIGGTNVAEGVFVPNGGWYPGIQTFGEQTFEQTYIARFGGNAAGISGDAVQAWSTMQVVQQAVEKIQSLNPAKLMAELRSDAFQTIQGPVQFNPDGSNADAVPFLFQWQQGQLIPVYPTSAAQENPEFPKPNWP
ncbi:MAG TPA: ABC transporter substrate-binding protein [Ktedonobacteraceae bacterium]|jgi:branched-chain amino acid transport system substrate-binding protein|nr:ABC transporter substrate-binding protein [Ktedonobacteraceae bacterium]